jgi:hypothetical protein
MMIRQFRQIKLPAIGTIIRNNNGGGAKGMHICPSIYHSKVAP